MAILADDAVIGSVAPCVTRPARSSMPAQAPSVTLDGALTAVVQVLPSVEVWMTYEVAYATSQRSRTRRRCCVTCSSVPYCWLPKLYAPTVQGQLGDLIRFRAGA